MKKKQLKLIEGKALRMLNIFVYKNMLNIFEWYTCLLLKEIPPFN